MKFSHYVLTSALMFNVYSNISFAQTAVEPTVITVEEQEELRSRATNAQTFVNSFVNDIRNGERARILEIAKKYGPSTAKLVEFYLDRIDFYEPKIGSTAAALAYALGSLGQFDGQTVPGKLVAEVFVLFGEASGLQSEHVEAVKAWFENEVSGLWIRKDNVGNTKLQFISKSGKDMRLIIKETDVTFNVVIKANNDLTFKTRDEIIQGWFSKSKSINERIAQFFSKQGLVTKQMDLIGHTEKEMTELYSKYVSSKTGNFPPMFVDINGMGFKFQGTGIPLAGTLTPKLDKAIILPNFSDFGSKNNRHMATDVYVEVDTIFNVQMGF